MWIAALYSAGEKKNVEMPTGASMDKKDYSKGFTKKGARFLNAEVISMNAQRPYNRCYKDIMVGR